MRYEKLRPEDNTFESIMVDVTHRCNMECSNCYLPNRIIPDMDKERLYDFISRLPKRTYIRLIGAEPTMREDIFDIISFVKRMGHKPSLTTNGLKLGRKEYVEKLKSFGLRMVLLSMNGADDDEIYKVVDNGKYAKLKTRALYNCLEEGMLVNTGTIVLKGQNEDVVTKQTDLFIKAVKETDYKSNVTPILRFRSMGLIGRNMGRSHILSFKELEQISLDQLPLKRMKIDKPMFGNNTTTNLYSLDSEIGTIYIRLVDWTVDDDGIPNSGNDSRGRITKDWKIAPFFEDVKENEFGY